MRFNTQRWLLTIWLSIAYKATAQSQTDFQIRPLNNTIARGNPVTFYCQVVSSVSISLSWRHNGTDVVYDNRVQQSVLSNGTLQLTIDPTMDGDNGNYSCVATDRSTQEEHTSTAYLQFAFIVEQFVRSPESKTVTLGDPVQFFCIQDRSLPLAEIAWLRDGTPLPVSSSDRYSVQSEELLHDMGRVSSVLLISSVRSSDAGSYGCRAVNPLLTNSPVYSDNATLTVEVPPAPPTFLIIPSSIVLPAAGVEVSFSCSVTGSPIPSITWLHDNNVISNSDSITITTLEQTLNTTLVISNVQQSDSGDYQCRAENNGGTITSDPAMLQIASISQEFQLQPPAVVLAVLNAVTIIPCGPPISVPPANVEWSKDFRQLIGSRFIVDGSNLTILDTQLSDSGIYYCTALNPLTTQSVVSRGANVSVKIAPRFTTEPVNSTAALNGRITFNCQASGDPSPTITWYRNQIPITGMDSRLQVIGGDLTIDPVMLSDDRSYTCEASNIVGAIQSTVYLNVQYPPEILPSFVSSMIAIEGHDALLNCAAEGNPAPTVTWLFGEDRLPGVLSNGSIILSSVQINNEGNYTCRATNLLGSTEAILTLMIQVPAMISADQSNVTVVEGQSVDLICQASGDPAPSITWYDNDGDLLVEQERISINDGVLTYSPAMKADEGTITCVATNSIRNSSANISLRVLVVPRIIKPDNITDIVLIEGNILSLDCSASGDPAPVISWIVPSYTESQGTNRLSTLSNGSLILFDVVKLDEGNYQCVAVNDAGSDHANVTVTVWVPATAQTLSSHSAVKGRNGVLNCQATGDPEPTIEWFRNNFLLVDNTKYTILENGSLWIRDIEDSDAGNYSCQATNAAGSHIATTNLIIFIIPLVVIPNPQIIGVQGQSLVLRCTTSGFPDPLITWHFNTREITVNDVPRLSVTPDGNLIINGVVANDNGIYRCVATNVAGSDMGTVNLTIHVPPSVEATIDSITAVQGDTLTLSCVAAGIPTPTIDWMRNGEPVVGQGSRITIVPSGDLTFDPVADDDEGTYQCFARNSAGVDDASITLTVLVPPRITQGPVNTTVSEGHSISLTCQANGDPPPTVSWMFNDHTITDNTVLTISMATRDDTGYYTCIANNSVGMASSTAYLNVFYPPAITQHPSSLTVPENSSVTFTCEADANPLAVFQWLLNNRRLTSGDTGVTVAAGRLMITRTSSSHVGQIACVAMNTEGTISSVATLIVLFHPTAPVNFMATVLSATSVNLTWGQPVDDGGTPITNYIITYHSNAMDHMILNTNNVQLTRQLDNLAPFTAYQLQVSAENIVGISPASTTVNVTTLVGAPTAPRSLNITASTDTSVTLSWMPPDPPNGPLSVYEVTYYAEDDEFPIIIPRFIFATTFTISSLQSSMVYIVNVRASTIADDSSLIFGPAATLRIMNGMILPPIIIPTLSSSMAMSSTMSSSPSPLATTVTSVTTSTSISRAVTSSTLTTTSGTTTSTVIAPSSSTTTTSIAAVTVISTTSVVTTTSTTITTSSLQSTIVTVLSTATSTSPMVPTTVASSASLSAMPSIPTITTSQLPTTELSSTSPTSSPTSTSVATSSSIIASPSPTPMLPPSVAPQWTMVQPLGRGTIYLRWSFTGGMVDGYIVTISPAPPDSPASRNVTDTTLTLMGLADYTTYAFTVAAYNAAGVGVTTPPQSARTVEGVPTAPRNVTVEKISSSSIRVSWEPPELINGILQSYTVQVMRSSSNTVLLSSTVNGSESSDIIMGLEVGLYSISVVALTGAGEGTPSDLVEFNLTTTTIRTTSAQVSSTHDVPVTTTTPTVTTTAVVPTETVMATSMLPSVTTTPSANVTAAVDDDDDDIMLLLEAIIPAGAVVIIIILLIILFVWCWWRRKGSQRTRRYRINEQSKRPRRRRIIDDKDDMVPFNEEDDDYFSSVQEALQTNFAFGSEDGDEMQTFGEHPSNDYTGPPLIPEDELEHSSEDEFDGPYATADQVARREKHMQEQQKTNDSNLQESTFDTRSNRSSNSGTYISSDSVRAKKRQDRSMSLSRSVTSGGNYRNDGDDDDTGFSPVPAGTFKLDGENSLLNSDVSSND